MNKSAEGREAAARISDFVTRFDRHDPAVVDCQR